MKMTRFAIGTTRALRQWKKLRVETDLVRDSRFPRAPTCTPVALAGACGGTGDSGQNRRALVSAALRRRVDRHVAWLQKELRHAEAELQALIEASPCWQLSAAVLRSSACTPAGMIAQPFLLLIHPSEAASPVRKPSCSCQRTWPRPLRVCCSGAIITCLATALRASSGCIGWPACRRISNAARSIGAFCSAGDIEGFLGGGVSRSRLRPAQG